MPSAIEQFLLGQIQEAPYQKQKPNLSKIEDALLAQIDELKLFRPGTSKVSDQSSLI